MNRFLLFLFIVSVSFTSVAQVKIPSKTWTEVTPNVSDIQFSKMLIANSNETYVISNKINSNGNSDIALTLYDDAGNVVWEYVNIMGPQFDDYGTAIASHPSGGIVGVGYLANSASAGYSYAFHLNPSGDLVWQSIIPNEVDHHDIPTSIACDENGEVAVSSIHVGSNSIADIKVSSIDADGNHVWSSLFDYAGFHDAPSNVSFDADGDIKIAGISSSSALAWDYTVLEYGIADGLLLNSERVEVPGFGLDNVTDVARDATGNIYITGYREDNQTKKIQTVKLDVDLNISWVKTFSNGIEDVASALTVDEDGNVIITGYSVKPNDKEDVVTIKYSVDGQELWTKYMKSLDGLEDAKGKSIVSESDGSVTVLSEVEENGEKDLVIVRYDVDGEKEFYSKVDNDQGADVGLDIGVKENGDIVINSKADDGNTNAQMVQQFEVITRQDEIIYQNGKPINAANQLVITFDPENVNLTAIDDKSVMAGSLDMFIDQATILEMNAALGTDISKARTYKIHRRLTSDITTSISRLGREVEIPPFWATLLIEFDGGLDLDQSIENLQTNAPGLKSAEKNWILRPQSTPPPPDDMEYNEQHFHFHDTFGIDSEGAWEDLGEVGGRESTRLGIIDTGIFWKHQDLHVNPEDTTFENSIIAGGWNYHDGGSPISNQSDLDSDPHGTRSAGIFCGVRNNGVGIAGVAGGDAWADVPPSPLYVFGVASVDTSNTYAFYSGVAAALIESATLSPDTFGFGINIMSISFGREDLQSGSNTGYLNAYPHFIEAFSYLHENDVISVAARGNEGLTVGPGSNPDFIPGTIGKDFGEDDWLITVGGVDTLGQWPEQYDTFLDANWQPGYNWLDVSSACRGYMDYSLLKGPNGETDMYEGFGGTSSATPQVAGVVALMYDHHNVESDLAEYHNNLAPDDAEYILEHTATNPANEDELYIGAGIVNAANAVEAVDKPIHGYEIIHSPGPISSTFNSDGVFEFWFGEDNSFGIPGPASYEVERFEVTQTFIMDTGAGEVVNATLGPDDDGIWERDGGSVSLPKLEENDFADAYEYLGTDFDITWSEAGGVVTVLATGYTYKLVELIENQFLEEEQEIAAEVLVDNEFQFPIAPQEVKTNFSLYCRWCDYIVGLHDIASENASITLFPSPANEVIHISAMDEMISEVRVFDIRGRLIELREALNTNELRIEIERLPKGVYTTQITLQDRTVVSRKFVKE